MAAVTDLIETIDPATGEVITEVPYASSDDIDEAVGRARRAFEPGGPWRTLLPAERARLLWSIGDLIDRHADELAELETRDQGQPIGISRHVSIVAASEHFRYYAGWVTKIAGETNPLSFPGTFNYTLREPVGVCGLIVPWNFPLMITAWKLAPALACGNTCVVKPAEQTPLTALRLVELLGEAGVPDGVVNVVTGGPTAGAAIAEHPGIDKVSFTGSTEAGRSIVRAAAGNFKRVSLELGGKNPAIVFDAPLDAAVAGVLQGGPAEQRTGMRGLQSRIRAALDRGAVRRGCCRRHRRCGSAPGWTPKRSSARSSPASIATASRPTSRSASRRAHSLSAAASVPAVTWRRARS